MEMGFFVTILPNAGLMYDTLSIEAYDNDYWWSNVWTKEQLEILNQLKLIGDFDFELQWSSKSMQKLRSGILTRKIFKNIKHYINDESNYRFYQY